MFRARLLYSVFERPKPTTTYGQGNGAWNVVEGSLNSNSVVVSVGVGHDISFDLAVSANHGCRIFLLDPSPTGKATIARNSQLPPSTTFLPVGLAATDGEIHFAAPMNPDEGSYRLSGSGEAHAEITFSCLRLKTLMTEQNLSSIDLLKIDIEGFEYAVIEDLLRSNVKVRQLCVEFHHGVVPGITRLQTIMSIFRLTKAGYQLCNHEGLNHTFIKLKP